MGLDAARNLAQVSETKDSQLVESNLIKRTLLAIAAVLGLAMATPAQAQFYVSGSTGTSFVQGQPNAIPLSAGLGMEFNRYLRGELDLDVYLGGTNGNSQGHVTTIGVVPKLFVQYPISVRSQAFIPYLSGGFGLASITGPGSITGQVSGLWTVGAGVMVPVNKSFQLGVGFEYAESTSPVVQQYYYTGQFQSSTIKLTGRYNF